MMLYLCHKDRYGHYKCCSCYAQYTIKDKHKSSSVKEKHWEMFQRTNDILTVLRMVVLQKKQKEKQRRKKRATKLRVGFA